MHHRILIAQAAEQDSTGRLLRRLGESAAFVGIGLVAFLIAFFIMTKISPFSLRKEIEDDQNTALGIIMGSVIIGLAIIIAAAIQG
jgi:putative membrane protein